MRDMGVVDPLDDRGAPVAVVPVGLLIFGNSLSTFDFFSSATGKLDLVGVEVVGVRGVPEPVVVQIFEISLSILGLLLLLEATGRRNFVAVDNLCGRGAPAIDFLLALLTVFLLFYLIFDHLTF